MPTDPVTPRCRVLDVPSELSAALSDLPGLVLRPDAPEAQRSFVYLTPVPGTLYLWESWLRHEVTPNAGRGDRISISFNYAGS